MLNKTEQIRTAWAAGDQIGALRIAANVAKLPSRKP
jgi:hypothetical protein